MNKYTQQFDNLLDAIQSIIMSFLVKLGPFAVALMPALFTAYAVYHTFKVQAGDGLALFFAVVVGLALETVGIVATHTATDLYNAQESRLIQPVKFWLMFLLIPVYVIGVAAVVGFSQDAFTPLVKGLGIASPFLTCIVYIAVALARDLHQAQAKQGEIESRQIEAEAEARAWQREKERIELEAKHTERLAKIDAKKAQPGAKVEPQNYANFAQNGENGPKFGPPLRVPKKEWRQNALDILRENSHITGAELGRRLGASDRTGQNILKELEGAGAIVSMNGSGWRVME